MANPTITACAADTWVKVATNVTNGMVYKVSSDPNLYLQTYRVTGDPAPTDTSDAIPLLDRDPISASAGIDVYVMAVNVAGSVRVDI